MSPSWRAVRAAPDAAREAATARRRAVAAPDPLLRWLVLDGYGFHQAYFRTGRYVHGRQVDADPGRPDGAPGGYRRRVVDQGNRPGAVVRRRRRPAPGRRPERRRDPGPSVDVVAEMTTFTLAVLGRVLPGGGLGPPGTIGAVMDRHAEVADLVREEARAALGDRRPTADDLPRLCYPTRVGEEAMRLYPPVWLLPRRAVTADDIGGPARRGRAGQPVHAAPAPRTSGSRRSGSTRTGSPGRGLRRHRAGAGRAHRPPGCCAGGRWRRPPSWPAPRPGTGSGRCGAALRDPAAPARAAFLSTESNVRDALYGASPDD
jgi:hypothetical protein